MGRLTWIIRTSPKVITSVSMRTVTGDLIQKRKRNGKTEAEIGVRRHKPRNVAATRRNPSNTMISGP